MGAFPWVDAIAKTLEGPMAGTLAGKQALIQQIPNIQKYHQSAEMFPLEKAKTQMEMDWYPRMKQAELDRANQPRMFQYGENVVSVDPSGRVTGVHTFPEGAQGQLQRSQADKAQMEADKTRRMLQQEQEYEREAREPIDPESLTNIPDPFMYRQKRLLDIMEKYPLLFPLEKRAPLLAQIQAQEIERLRASRRGGTGITGAMTPSKILMLQAYRLRQEGRHDEADVVEGKALEVSQTEFERRMAADEEAKRAAAAAARGRAAESNVEVDTAAIARIKQQMDLWARIAANPNSMPAQIEKAQEQIRLLQKKLDLASKKSQTMAPTSDVTLPSKNPERVNRLRKSGIIE